MVTARPADSIDPVALVGDLGEYAGRGLVVGSLDDGHPFLAYFVTGRSPASLSRRATIRPDGSVSIEPNQGGPADELRHYVAVCRAGEVWVVGNGVHVEAAAAPELDELWRRFRSWAPEPDPPIWTPRIVAAIPARRSPPVVVAAARRHTGEGTEHRFLAADAVPAGLGVRATTYHGTVDPPRPDGQPRWVRTGGDVEHVAQRLWEALPNERRVLVVARDLEAERVVYLDRVSSDA